MKTMRWILASGSPRRRELLGQLGIIPQVMPSRIEETTEAVEPMGVVMELSSKKAEEVAARVEGEAMILGADTVVSIDGEILGKPHSHEEAYEIISRLQGRAHEVYTGVTLIWKKAGSTCGVTFVEKTQVCLYPMEEEEIRSYAWSQEPMDKAGAYGIQGRFAVFVKSIYGDYSNVVGLPVGKLYQVWKELVGQEDTRKGRKP